MDSDNDTYKMLTVLNGGGASTCTVTGLIKYQSYEFFIVPFYKSVEGKPSNSRVARTLEDGKFIRLKFFFLFVRFIFAKNRVEKEWILNLFNALYTFEFHLKPTKIRANN